MLTSTLSDARAWQADTIDSSEEWYYPIPERTLSALTEFMRPWQRDSQPVTDLWIPDKMRAELANDLQPALTALEQGRGFVVLTSGQSSQYSPKDWQAMYWLVGQLLGKPIVQNVQGTVLYDVRDTGQNVQYGARFSVTSSESTFHTDNSFGTELADYVGLLCLNTARSGGLSQIVSGRTVWNKLRARQPEAAKLLCQPFHIDRRGGVKPGDEPTIQFPVVSEEGPELLIRYLRYWIEVGQEKVGRPLTADQKNALDLLDRVAAEPGFRVEFSMRPGEMLFVNNRWILHNRTGFEDFAEPERKRHYVRLWLQRAE